MSIRKRPVVVNGVTLWTCPKCKHHKVPEEFYRASDSNTSTNRLSSYCKHCQRGLTRDYHRRRAAVQKRDAEELTRLRELVAKDKAELVA